MLRTEIERYVQNLCINGTLRFTEIGGIICYKHDDIMQVLEGNGKRK
jgi:hypothetical protein